MGIREENPREEEGCRATHSAHGQRDQISESGGVIGHDSDAQHDDLGEAAEGDLCGADGSCLLCSHGLDRAFSCMHSAVFLQEFVQQYSCRSLAFDAIGVVWEQKHAAPLLLAASMYAADGELPPCKSAQSNAIQDSDASAPPCSCNGSTLIGIALLLQVMAGMLSIKASMPITQALMIDNSIGC